MDTTISAKKNALSITDYKNILRHYQQKIPKQRVKIIESAERILSNKLCKCIKSPSFQNKEEATAIAICTNAIFTKHGLRRGKFTCKKKINKNNYKNKRSSSKSKRTLFVSKNKSFKERKDFF
jgi:hypothetical protein